MQTIYIEAEKILLFAPWRKTKNRPGGANAEPTTPRGDVSAASIHPRSVIRPIRNVSNVSIHLLQLPFSLIFLLLNSGQAGSSSAVASATRDHDDLNRVRYWPRPRRRRAAAAADVDSWGTRAHTRHCTIRSSLAPSKATLSPCAHLPVSRSLHLAPSTPPPPAAPLPSTPCSTG